MKVAVTFPGKIGDCLYSLPTCRKLYERYGVKLDFFTSTYCIGLKNLFENQSCINSFQLSPNYQILRYDCGIQPWAMNVPSGYDIVFHLGYRTTPNKALHQFIGSQQNIEVGGIYYEYKQYQTLDEPYVILAPHNDVRYMNLFREFIRNSPYQTVIVGSKDEYFGEGVDKTGLDFLDVLTWIANSEGFIGMSSNYVLAEGFNIPKVVPHDGHTFDMRHLIYDNKHFFPINPTLKTLLGELNLMKTYSKTLDVADYETLGGYSQHILNIVDHFIHTKGQYRYEHEHRKWEYGLAYKALDEIKAKRILDIGGGGSVFAPAMEWVGINTHQVDMGDVGGWIKNQSERIGKTLTFDQMDFLDYKTHEKFDAVVSISVIEHVSDDIAFFKKMLSMVKDGGLAILTTDFHPSGKQIVGGHIRTYNKESLENLISIAKEEGFELFGDGYDYDYFAPNVNGCDFASLVLQKGKKVKSVRRKQTD